MSPVQIDGSIWKDVSAAYAHTCATRTDGTLWCWGDNQHGAVGIGSVVTPQMSPSQVAGTSWATIGTGGAHTCAIRTDGTLWCWGYNGYGEIGIGSAVTPQTSPIKVGVDTTWNSVASGIYHTCATRTGGTLWCWGLNTSGQLGNGGVGSTQTSPVQIGVETDWTSVVAGHAHTCGTRAGGTLWCWGYNLTGQLGLGHITTQTSPVRVGTGTVLAVFTGSAAFSTYIISND